MKKHTLNNCSGQSIALVVLTILVLSMFSFMVVNIGMLSYTRIRMQNAADAAALTAARRMSRSLNVISAQNLLMNGVLTRIRILGRDVFAVEQRLLPAFRAARAAIDAAVRAGSGGFAYFAAREAARRNGADRVIPAQLRNMLSLQLQRRVANPWVYRIVNVGGVPIPVPAGRAGRGTVFYMRRWSPNLVRPQPPHRVRYIAIKEGDAPFAAALFRGIRTARPSVRAIAEAKIWLDVRPNSFHRGGFPRTNEGWVEGIGVQSFWPHFNASLTGITLPLYMH